MTIKKLQKKQIQEINNSNFSLARAGFPQIESYHHNPVGDIFLRWRNSHHKEWQKEIERLSEPSAVLEVIIKGIIGV